MRISIELQGRRGEDEFPVRHFAVETIRNDYTEWHQQQAQASLMQQTSAFRLRYLLPVEGRISMSIANSALTQETVGQLRELSEQILEAL